jgi:hypothetical protein
MGIEHHKITVEGERCGDFVRRGEVGVFYTTHQKLQLLHGQAFTSVDDVRRAIRAAFRQPSSWAA